MDVQSNSIITVKQTHEDIARLIYNKSLTPKQRSELGYGDAHLRELTQHIRVIPATGEITIVFVGLNDSQKTAMQAARGEIRRKEVSLA